MVAANKVIVCDNGTGVRDSVRFCGPLQPS
jgi:hypothetical protein